ncbi:MAG TPA: MFS transporter [Gammaproteobacteria bacterium]|jgi:UMF1 family MFS transporter|nr:MFS transporter [Gammaproteobacteria bacterium]
MSVAVATDAKRGDLRAIVSWALFDFAGAPFSVLIVTFVYATYFTKAFTSDPNHGTALWSRGVSTTALIVALCSPLLGALADRGGYRKRFLGIATLVCAAGSAALYWVLPGQVLLALACVVVANVAFEFAAVFNNAFLPDLAPRNKVGTLSGIGWASGYVGGLLALVIALVTLVNPATPWFGFSTEAGENIRATNLLVAIWFLVFSVPLFLWVPEDRSRASPAARVVPDAFAQLKRTFTEIRKYRQIVRFLLARLFYNDGLVTVFAFGGVYAGVTFGFTFQQVILFGIVINVAAVIGAVALAFLDDWIGGKRTIVISLVGLSAATLLAMLAPSAAVFWVAGISIGIFAGPNQAASRSLMARFVPHDVENEFFGFFAFSGKLTAFIGPFFLGVLTEWSGSQRVGVGVVVVLFVVGLVALHSVDEREGRLVRAQR